MLCGTCRQRPGSARRKRPLPPSTSERPQPAEASPPGPSPGPGPDPSLANGDGVGRPSSSADFFSTSGLSRVLGPRATTWSPREILNHLQPAGVKHLPAGTKHGLLLYFQHHLPSTAVSWPELVPSLRSLPLFLSWAQGYVDCRDSTQCALVHSVEPALWPALGSYLVDLPDLHRLYRFLGIPTLSFPELLAQHGQRIFNRLHRSGP
eukprot:RCo022352